MSWPCHFPDFIHSLCFVRHPSCNATTTAVWALRDAAMPSAKRPCLRCKGTYSCYRTAGFSPGCPSATLNGAAVRMSTGADHIVQKGTRSVSEPPLLPTTSLLCYIACLTPARLVGDEQQPGCGRCEKRGVECHYPERKWKSFRRGSSAAHEANFSSDQSWVNSRPRACEYPQCRKSCYVSILTPGSLNSSPCRPEPHIHNSSLSCLGSQPSR